MNNKKQSIPLSSLSKGLRAQIRKEISHLTLAKSSPLESCLQAITEVEELLKENKRYYDSTEYFAIKMKIYEGYPDTESGLDEAELEQLWNDYTGHIFESFHEDFEENWTSTPALKALRSTAPGNGAAGRSSGWFVINADDLKEPFAYELEDVRDLPDKERLELTDTLLDEEYGLTAEYLRSMQDYAEALLKFLQDTQKDVASIVKSIPKAFAEYLEDCLEIRSIRAANVRTSINR